MGLLARIFNFSLEDPAQPLLPMSALFDSLGLGRSDAGVLINERQAMRMTTVFSCIKIISQDLSRVSFDIIQELPDGGTRKAKEHRLYDLLHTRPNPSMSAMDWRMAMIANMCSWGNAYSYIGRDNANRAISLTPLDPAKTHPTRTKDGKLIYETRQTPDGQAAFIDPEDILHFKGFTVDGLIGLSPIGICKNAVGIGLAAEKFGAVFFANSARASGVLEHPGMLGAEAYENLKKSVHEWATGENALRPLILEEGLTWKQLTIPPEEAQYLETRKFQKEEIAQLFRVPLHLLQDLTRSTNNNIEHQGMDYVRSCLAPIATCIEQEINYKLLGGPYQAVHNLFDLQRGDFATVTTSICQLRNAGIFSANDALRQLNENPISENEGGNLLIVNGTYQPLKLLTSAQPLEAPAPGEQDTAAPAAFTKTAILNSYRPLFRDAVGRAINRSNDQEFVKKAVRPAVDSMLQTFLASKFGFCTLNKGDLEFIAQTVQVVAEGAGEWKDASDVATKLTEAVYSCINTRMEGN